MVKNKNEKLQKQRLASKYKMGWFFMAPGFIIQAIFGWFPLVVVFVIAFQKFQVIGPSQFVGLSNFRIILDDPMTPIVFKNTLFYTVLSLALTFIIPIIVAIMLLEMSKATIRVMMILWFIPYSSMAGLILWKWFYNPFYGLFNGILVSLGLPTLRWLNDPHLAMLCLILPGLLMFAPGLIYIATLQSIPREYYEAAELEGAGFWQKIWSITLPRIRPIMAMMLILAVINNMQVFNQPMVMTAGGPANATRSVVMYIWELAFNSMYLGRGASLAILLFFLIMILVLLQRKYFKEDLDK
ncbi:sugar ABC transporter permease [Candidatus Aerophobetes bacterium]|nr:sugar ABC transporter permease [Candidatus Aerophobetes bacterium]